MSKRQKLFTVISVLLTFALMCVIFYLSSQPADESGALSNSLIAKIHELIGVLIPSKVIRKAAHACEFCLLAFLFANSFNSLKVRKWHVFSLICTFFYACTDEFHQLFVPGRAGMFSDVLIDASGAVFGIAVYFVIIKIIHTVRRKRNVRNSSVQSNQTN